AGGPGDRKGAVEGKGVDLGDIKNICSHEAAYEETGNQAVSYTTGVPAMIGSAMVVQGNWKGDGVFNMEEMDPDPFMDMLNAQGLPWTVEELDGPVSF
ncbi:MAG: saccharopine dehydrogenase family protein, partial [Novosphingobium sp.]|nr:saccharopine dehydrogenase family protein [Novosphingobium sp.]